MTSIQDNKLIKYQTNPHNYFNNFTIHSHESNDSVRMHKKETTSLVPQQFHF